MVGYATAGDDPSLFPDEPNEYAVVAMDEFKAPDDDDFIAVISEFENDEFELPVEKESMTYYVHTADGEVMTRSEWEAES